MNQHKQKRNLEKKKEKMQTIAKLYSQLNNEIELSNQSSNFYIVEQNIYEKENQLNKLKEQLHFESNTGNLEQKQTKLPEFTKRPFKNNQQLKCKYNKSNCTKEIVKVCIYKNNNEEVQLSKILQRPQTSASEIQNNQNEINKKNISSTKIFEQKLKQQKLTTLQQNSEKHIKELQQKRQQLEKNIGEIKEAMSLRGVSNKENIVNMEDHQIQNNQLPILINNDDKKQKINQKSKSTIKERNLNNAFTIDFVKEFQIPSSQLTQKKLELMITKKNEEIKREVQKQKIMMDAKLKMNSQNIVIRKIANMHESVGLESNVIGEYITKDIIGKGSYAIVKLAYHSKSKQEVAIKIYDKFKMSEPAKKKNMEREIQILKQLNHKNCIQLIELIDLKRTTNLVLEYIGQTSLHSYLKKIAINHRMKERHARRIFLQIAEAVYHMHELNVVHRDIKLENVLLDNEYEQVKIIDFGFSITVNDDRLLKIFCGTPNYMAPELIKKQPYCGKKVDCWALGVLLYTILIGDFPFSAKSENELYRVILKGVYKLDEVDFISSSAKKLIQNILVQDIDFRLNVNQVFLINFIEFFIHQILNDEWTQTFP